MDCDRFKVKHFAIFAFLWAIAILWHYLRRPVDFSQFYVLFIPAVLVLARPKVGIFFLALSVGYIYVFNYELPFSTRPNHPTLTFLISLTILTSAIWVIAKDFISSRQLKLDIVQWFDIFRPLVIMAINIVYIMSVFNKLNYHFLDVNYSPVTRLLNFYFETSHLLFVSDLIPRETWVLQIGIIATLTIETAIPLFLSIRRLRLMGILLGLLFHTIISIRMYPPMAEFPTLMFAVYILALPDTAIPTLYQLFERMRQLRWFSTLRNGLFIFIGWFFFYLPEVFQWPAKENKLLITRSNIWGYSWAIYLVIYYLIILYLLKRTKFGLSESSSIRWFQPRNIIFYIFPFLVLLNGFTPYLGLKNKGSWNMYSHLRTEAGYSNHLFMPNIYIFPYMNEVCIIDSSDNEMRKIARNKKLLTESGFTDWARNNPNESVEFFYQGEYFNVEHIGDVPQFIRDKQWLEEIFWISDSGDGFDYLDWCQRYIPGNGTGEQITITLKNFTYVLWNEDSKWTSDDDE